MEKEEMPKKEFEVLREGIDSGTRTGNMGKDGCGY